MYFSVVHVVCVCLSVGLPVCLLAEERYWYLIHKEHLQRTQFFSTLDELLAGIFPLGGSLRVSIADYLCLIQGLGQVCNK